MNELKKHRQSPIYQKAEEILDIVQRITSGAKTSEESDIENVLPLEDPDTADPMGDYRQGMISGSVQDMHMNIMTICAKLAGAMGSEMYMIKMENASLIRKAAMDLILNLRGLEMGGFKQVEYLDLCRGTIEEFRILFAEWVKSFDPYDGFIDRWGLFNAPGINYDDHDPDEDIPFDAEKYMEEFLGEDDEGEEWKRDLPENDEDGDEE